MIIIISLYDIMKKVWLENHRELGGSIHVGYKETKGPYDMI